MNPQEERSFRGKILKRKDPQDPHDPQDPQNPQDPQDPQVPQDPQDPQDPQAHQEERYSGGFSRGVLLNCSMLVCCRLFSQIA